MPTPPSIIFTWAACVGTAGTCRAGASGAPPGAFEGLDGKGGGRQTLARSHRAGQDGQSCAHSTSVIQTLVPSSKVEATSQNGRRSNSMTSTVQVKASRFGGMAKARWIFWRASSMARAAAVYKRGLCRITPLAVKPSR